MRTGALIMVHSSSARHISGGTYHRVSEATETPRSALYFPEWPKNAAAPILHGLGKPHGLGTRKPYWLIIENFTKELSHTKMLPTTNYTKCADGFKWAG